MSDIRFKPWVGDRYGCGIVGYDANGKIIYGTENHIGKRVLVLGESHYCANPEAEATPFLTINIIADLLNPDSEWEPYKNTYTKFAKSFVGCIGDLDSETKAKAWHHVVFYNYVQVAMSGTRVAPTASDFQSSATAFFEVLERYTPDIVIAWGQRLYNNLPQGGKQLPDLTIDSGRFAGNATELWSYQVAGKSIAVMPITHPSAAYSTECFNAFFRELIRNI
jgi:hypothetical protein